ncbi:MAG TPA: hypothetical protein GX728_01260 [Clostridiaceae bacterium]|nr:hypothetical protein [Clostridiaceae bacterium]
MKSLLRNIRIFVVVFTVLFALFITGVIAQSNRARTTWLESAGEDKAALKSRYKMAGEIITADDVILAGRDEQGNRRYAANDVLAEAALHLVGDYTHNITNTLESLWQDHLLGSGRPFLTQLKLDLSGKGLEGDDLLLTVRSDLMIEAARALKGKRGAVAIMNYRTGEVYALVSKPSVAPENVIAWKNIPDTALFNRALLGRYVPGSTFKIVTATAFLNQREYPHDLKVTCRGKKALMPGGVFERYMKSTHGTPGLEKAFATSCNHYFGHIGLLLGAQPLKEAAKALAFNTEFSLDRLKVAPSVCDIGHEDDAAITWAAIGQPGGKDRVSVTPLHLAMIASAIANGGVMRQPYIVEATRTPMGEIREIDHDATITILDRLVTDKMSDMMRSVVTDGTGKKANIKGIDIRGKTGTANVEDEDGKMVTNNLFAGFIADEKTPFAIGIVLEDSRSGTAPAVAGTLLRYAVGKVR